MINPTLSLQPSTELGPVPTGQGPGQTPTKMFPQEGVISMNSLLSPSDRGSHFVDVDDRTTRYFAGFFYIYYISEVSLIMSVECFLSLRGFCQGPRDRSQVQRGSRPSKHCREEVENQ